MTHAASKLFFDDMYHSTATGRTMSSVFRKRKEFFFLQDTASELVAWLERASDREQASFKTRAVRYCITACTVVLLWWSGLHFVG